MPAPVLEFVAGQLGVADPLVVNKYGERVKTLSDHQLEIRRAEGLRDFTEAQEELATWVAARPDRAGYVASITRRHAGMGEELGDLSKMALMGRQLP